MVISQFKILTEHDSAGRTGFLAITAEDAPAEVDSEPLRIAPAVFILGGLQRDAVDGTRGRAEVAPTAALAAVGVAREYDPPAPPRRDIRLTFRILHRHRPPAEVREN